MGAYTIIYIIILINNYLVYLLGTPDPSLPALEVQQLVVDPLDVDVGPQHVVVAVDRVDDAVVQAVQLLQQGQLLADLQQLGVVGHRQPEQLLAARVRLVLPEQVVEAVLGGRGSS